MSEPTLVTHQWLRDVTTRIQIGFGVPEDQAQTVADCLVEANLMGLDTHGVIRLKFYMDRIPEGGNNPHPKIERIRDNPCTALLDADQALGPVGAKAGMDLAIEKAADTGLALVLVRNGNHYGPAGHYARMALAHDMIGVSITNVLASMPPTGGGQPRIGNNPYAIAVPAGEEPPVVVDGATSKSSWGKLFLCAQTGADLPADCFVGPDGAVTVDPKVVMSGGGLLPMAAHKGYGIAAAITLLTGMLASGELDQDIPHPYKKLDAPGANTFAMAAVRIDQFDDPTQFKQRMDDWIQFIRNTPKAPDVDRIWLPGEMELVKREQRLRNGIPLNPEMMDELKGLAMKVHIPFDVPENASGPS